MEERWMEERWMEEGWMEGKMNGSKGIVILGSSGSIGQNALEVVRHHRGRFRVYGLSVDRNIEVLRKQVKEFGVSRVVVTNRLKYEEAKVFFCGVEVLYGEEGLYELVSDGRVDMVVNALVGFSGLMPTVEGIQNGKDIAIANKESIVVGGDWVMGLARERGVNMIPIDSEHSAIFSLMKGRGWGELEKVILTCSGGPFLGMGGMELREVRVEDALKHPRWNMGKKITVDSSTLMNKGLEVIEAKHLFGVNFGDIEVLIHKESIIHGLVQMIDGGVYAQMGLADMKFAIQSAMTYPEVCRSDYGRLDLVGVGQLSFEEPDEDSFPLLKVCYEVGIKGGTMPAVLNAANEVAVGSFLEGEIDYLDIHRLIGEVLEGHEIREGLDMKVLLDMDRWAREYGKELISRWK